ncbi:unnamed protein product [Acanthoscelides obtectus]|nr:unnamed protein product [Acanthoscelides obtectus]CAK1623028.1 ADP-ribosylation factor-binding protein GGA1 [Acanthoscelides obtectus]
MLDNYEPTKSTAGELDLIKELHDNCERLRPTINKLALETQDSDGMLGAVLETNDEISSVFHKYNVLILQSQAASSKAPNGMQSSLLHFECDDSSTIQNACKAEPKSSVDVLCDILTATTIPDNSGEVLKPVSVLNCDKISVCDDDKEMRQNKFKALEDLDVLDISDEKMLVVDKASNVGSPSIPNMNNEKKTIQDSKRHDIKLSDVFVKLEDIRPSNIPPITLMEEKNKISVTLHISKDKPKDFVNVYVLTAVSKSELPLSNYLFQAVLPKECKLKLQPPSSTNLPAYNPFLPPSAITQIMIIANPDSTKLTLKFVISYVMDDETITEMGEVDELPTLQE